MEPDSYTRKEGGEGGEEEKERGGAVGVSVRFTSDIESKREGREEEARVSDTEEPTAVNRRKSAICLTVLAMSSFVSNKMKAGVIEGTLHTR